MSFYIKIDLFDIKIYNMEYTKVSTCNKLIMYWEKKYSKLDRLNTLSIKENDRPMTESEYNFELMGDSDGWNSD